MTTMRFALMVVLLFAGCATGTPLWITNDFDPAKDPRRFERDRYECRRDATYMSPGTSVGIPLQGGLILQRSVGEGPEIDLDTMKACMAARGYRLIYVDPNDPNERVRRWRSQ